MTQTMVRPLGTMDVHELALMWHLGDTPGGTRRAHIPGVYRLTRFTPEQVREACLIKYRRRFLTPGYPKDDRAERLAVEHLLEG